jgi:hypothetical protein
MSMSSLHPQANRLLSPIFIIAIKSMAWFKRQVLDLYILSVRGHLDRVAKSKILFSTEPHDNIVFPSSLQGEASFASLQRN